MISWWFHDISYVYSFFYFSHESIWISKQWINKIKAITSHSLFFATESIPTIFSNWRLKQPDWKLFVKLDAFLQVGKKTKNRLKPSPEQCSKNPCDIPLNPGWLIGILLLAYCHPYITGFGFYLWNNPTNQGFDIRSHHPVENWTTLNILVYWDISGL